MQDSENCWPHPAELKTELRNNELAGLQNIDTQDKKPSSHPRSSRRRAKVKCTECGKYFSKSSLLNHKRTEVNISP